MMKILGAMMILFGCGGIGFLMVAAHRHQERSLMQMVRALEYMRCELQYRMTPLPSLCIGASDLCTGCVRNVLYYLGKELDAKVTPDAADCMFLAVDQCANIPEKLQCCLMQLADSLGRFDLAGQLQGLEAAKRYAEFELERIRNHQDVRLRSYQTLGLCAGAAIVVLFL